MVPIPKIIRRRNLERPPSRRIPASAEDSEEGEEAGPEGVCSRVVSLFAPKVKSKVSAEEEGKVPKTPKEVTTYREVCWKLSERGAVGETGLHMCLLVATVVHLELARRLVRLFPKLVNDVYASDEYYGMVPYWERIC